MSVLIYGFGTLGRYKVVTELPKDAIVVAKPTERYGALRRRLLSKLIGAAGQVDADELAPPKREEA